MRVALVGCGRIGTRRAETLLACADTLVAVADVDERRAAALARAADCPAFTRWDEVVRRDDVDAVVVSTTHNWLAPVTIAAIQYGKHVLVEKPMGRDLADAAAVVAAATDHPGVVVQVGFNHRHHTAVRRAYEMCAGGGLGDVLWLRCRYGHGGRPGYGSEWRARRALAGGGELLDQGIHAIDLFRWFAGEFSEAIGFTAAYVWTGNGARPAEGHTQRSGDAEDVEDNGFAMFRTAAGQVAQLHASWTQWKNLFSFEVCGREGYLVVDGLGGSYGLERLTVAGRRHDGGVPEPDIIEFPGAADGSWKAEWEEFMSAIREQRQPLTSHQDGLRAMTMVTGVYESARTGRLVRV